MRFQDRKSKELNLSNSYLKSVLPFAQFLSNKQHQQLNMNSKNHSPHNLLFSTYKSKRNNFNNSKSKVIENSLLLIKNQYPISYNSNTPPIRNLKPKAMTINFTSEPTNQNQQNNQPNQNRSNRPKLTHIAFTQRKSNLNVDQKKIKQNICKKIQSNNLKTDTIFKNINKILYIEQTESKNRPKLESLQEFLRQRIQKKRKIATQN